MREAGSRGSLPGGVRPPSEVSGTIGAMRRLLTWLVVSLGIAALIRRLRRSSGPAETAPAEQPAAAAADDDPADELRRKLAEARVDEEPAAVSPTPVTVEERRAEVHGQGRSALEEMRETDEG